MAGSVTASMNRSSSDGRMAWTRTTDRPARRTASSTPWTAAGSAVAAVTRAGPTVTASPPASAWPGTTAATACHRAAGSAGGTTSISYRSRSAVSSAIVPPAGDPPADHDRHPPANRLQLAEQVAVDEDRLAPLPQAQQHVADVPAADRVDAVGRLVEQDQVRGRSPAPGPARPAASCPWSTRPPGGRPRRTCRPRRPARPPAAGGSAGRRRPGRRRTPASGGRSGTGGSGGARAGTRPGPGPACGRPARPAACRSPSSGGRRSS